MALFFHLFSMDALSLPFAGYWYIFVLRGTSYDVLASELLTGVLPSNLAVHLLRITSSLAYSV